MDSLDFPNYFIPNPVFCDKLLFMLSNKYVLVKNINNTNQKYIRINIDYPLKVENIPRAYSTIFK